MEAPLSWAKPCTERGDLVYFVRRRRRCPSRYYNDRQRCRDGCQPTGALLCSGVVYQVIENDSGFFGTATPQHVPLREVLWSDLRVWEKSCKVLFEAAFSQHPHIGEIVDKLDIPFEQCS